MKKTFVSLAAVLALAACGGNVGQQNAAKTDVLAVVASQLADTAAFADTLDGKAVALYNLQAGEIAMQVTNYGARVVSIFTPDKNGGYVSVVAGHNTLQEYVTPPGERFLGACVGPVANRIGKASFVLDGQTYLTPANDNAVNTLHGGYLGLDNLVWDVQELTDSTIVLHCLHPDGLEGYPGNLDIKMTYSVTSDNCFTVDYLATTDKATPVNISNHPFFNLRGEGVGTVEDYVMQINASKYTPIDELSIPLGTLDPVEGTPFDFREAHTIGKMIGEENQQLANARGYDHNWVLDRKTADGLETACTVWDPETGRFLEVITDQPGLQFYSGNFFFGTEAGRNGTPLGFRSSLALETQKFPDTPNNPEFGDITLRPGETYTQKCIYKFSVKAE